MEKSFGLNCPCRLRRERLARSSGFFWPHRMTLKSVWCCAASFVDQNNILLAPGWASPRTPPAPLLGLRAPPLRRTVKSSNSKHHLQHFKACWLCFAVQLMLIHSSTAQYCNDGSTFSRQVFGTVASLLIKQRKVTSLSFSLFLMKFPFFIVLFF